MYINFHQTCTPAQYRAVQQHDGPILLVACPGSGKTHTLVYRAAHMLQSGINPDNILLTSFTRKAAHEMTERIVKLIGPDARGIWAGTFHSIALKLLRSHYTLLGFESAFSVMSQGDQTDLMKMIRSDAKDVMPDGIKLPTSKDLVSYFSAIRNKCEDLKIRVALDYKGLEEVLLWMYSEYVFRKTQMCLADYDDLLFGLRDVLRAKPNLRATYSRKFQYIMVDEFQDTNPVQMEIVLMLTDQHDNLMVVGDESQSIYAFRGATIANILTITEHFPNMTVMRLEENHRSTAPIVNLLNMTLQHATEKIDKTMRSVAETNGNNIAPKIHAVATGFKQAEYVAQKIDSLHRAGVPYHDIAVLYRNAYHANIVDMYLTQQRIPFVRWGGIKFTEAAHVLDVLAFLKVRVNPLDRVSWRRLLLMLPGVGPAAVNSILSEILPVYDDNPFLSLRQVQPPWEALEAVQSKAKYTQHLRALGRVLADLDVHDHAGAAFDTIWTYYEPFCRKLYAKDFDFRRHGVGQLREIAVSHGNIAEFLDEFATEDAEPEESSEQQIHDQLVLSTIHSAKGREWQHVFVIELVEGALIAVLSRFAR